MDMEQVEDALEDCQSALRASNCPFSSWEREFIESVVEQWEERQHLTSRQREVLAEIWDKV